MENDEDEARADRIEWLFRKKLGAEWAKRGREWLESYDSQVSESGRVARETKSLYNGTAELIREMVRTIETLALQPNLGHDDHHFMSDGVTRYCQSCGIVMPHDGWKKSCPQMLPKITVREQSS